MPLVPARCLRCGFKFQPAGGILVEGASNVTISNSTTNCPRCGGTAQFLDGTFDAVDGAISMRSGPRWSWELIEELGLALKRIVEEQPDDPIGLIAQVDEGFAGQLRRVTTGWSRADIIALVSLLVTIFFGLRGPSASDMAPVVGIEEVHQRVSLILDQAQRQGVPPVSNNLPGRNSPCWCGSGVKFKKCHGAPPTMRR